MTEEQRAVLTKRRWVILAASCLINLCIGSLYAWSVFSGPMAEYLSMVTGQTVTTGTLSVVFTVANSVGPITLIGGGLINDKAGPKWVILAGGFLFGAGMIFSGYAKNLETLICGYGLCCGLGMGLVYGCTISNSVKFFPDKRGLIGGIATASYGISSVLIPPAANFIIGLSDVRFAFISLGILFILVICSSAFLIKACPDGFTPTGYQTQKKEVTLKKTAGVDKNWKQMLADPIFYIMILLLTCGAVFGLMTISQISPIAQNMVGMSVASATIAVSVLALFNAAGRVVAGYISDIIGRINTLIVMLILATMGLLFLFTAGEGDISKFYVCVSVIGLCFGAFMGVFPGFTADQFGVKNNSVNYGIMFIGFALAGYVGPAVMSKLYLSTGGYQTSFLTAMLLAVAGLGLSMVYRVKSRKHL